jgi:hypothetical protein
MVQMRWPVGATGNGGRAACHVTLVLHHFQMMENIQAVGVFQTVRNGILTDA